eukprot:m.8126 g.8126  ORF g.8126 m.8126 type:complete len:111 (+) comp6029_c0_seq1:131-463(+)
MEAAHKILYDFLIGSPLEMETNFSRFKALFPAKYRGSKLVVDVWRFMHEEVKAKEDAVNASIGGYTEVAFNNQGGNVSPSSTPSSLFGIDEAANYLNAALLATNNRIEEI